MNTSTKLFNAIENANLKKVRSIVLTNFREKDGRVDAAVYNSIIEVLVRDGYASLTTMMNRSINRRTGHHDDSTGTTIFQMFRGCLPPFVQMYIKTVDMTTYEKHTATIG
ncbi:TPA: hypothetical protein UN036_000405 [Stenotrophomonas maltophilia]|nr:hypothetical protein [Stenotrophomonas maltophilia]